MIKEQIEQKEILLKKLQKLVSSYDLESEDEDVKNIIKINTKEIKSLEKEILNLKKAYEKEVEKINNNKEKEDKDFAINVETLIEQLQHELKIKSLTKEKGLLFIENFLNKYK